MSLSLLLQQLQHKTFLSHSKGGATSRGHCAYQLCFNAHNSSEIWLKSYFTEAAYCSFTTTSLSVCNVLTEYTNLHTFHTLRHLS